MIRLVPTNKIVPHPTHTLIEQDKIDKYRKLLRSGSPSPPLLVSRQENGTYQLHNGHHVGTRVLERDSPKLRSLFSAIWSRTEATGVQLFGRIDEKLKAAQDLGSL
jgi:hypothetical protein